MHNQYFFHKAIYEDSLTDLKDAMQTKFAFLSKPPNIYVDELYEE